MLISEPYFDPNCKYGHHLDCPIGRCECLCHKDMYGYVRFKLEGERMEGNVGDLKAVIADLPNDIPVIIEIKGDNTFYEMERVFAIGTKTDNPGLVIKAHRWSSVIN